MPKLDRLKEELAIHKQLFFASLAIMFGLTGWTVTHLSLSIWVIGSSVLAVIFSAVFAYSQYRRMNQLLEEIENVN